MDRTNLERQRRWQARHTIKPTQSSEEIAERLRDVLDREKMERVATLLWATGSGVNNGSHTGYAADEQVKDDVNNASSAERIAQLEAENAKLREQLGGEQAEDDVNNASRHPDQETLQLISNLFRTLKRDQMRHLCNALMRRLKIKGNAELEAKNIELRKQLDDAKQKLRETNAEAADAALLLQNKSLQAKLKKAELSYKLAWKRVDELKSASAGTVIMTGAEHRAVVMCLHPDRATTSIDEKHLNVAMSWFNGLNVVKQQKAS